MRVRKNRPYAVVTGDVIGSSSLSAPRRRALHRALTTTSKAFRTTFRNAAAADADVFRGDSWQFVLKTPRLVLRAALFYRAYLRARTESHKLDTRMALAIGTIQFIPGNRVSHGDGEAFQLSGKALETMDKNLSMNFRFEGRPVEERSLSVIVQLVDALAARWSDKQALAVTGALQGWTQDQIGRRCWKKAISQQAVAQHLDRAAWASVEAAIQFFEETVESALGRKQAK